MPPRPTLRRDSQRPLSAIYIGTQPATSPSPAGEPLSPASSVGSGLPSPPATNSTGSGSTGDPATIARRLPMDNTATSSRHSELDGDDDEQTMRLKITPTDAVLHRARILAQRNRIQLDKMASERLGRASPSSSSSSRNQRHSMPDPSQVLSGSETEREGDSSVFNSTSTTSSGSTNRVRLSSAPTSPHRARVQAGTNSPTRRRKRVSLATNAYDDNSDEENGFYDNPMGRDGERYQVGTARDRIRDSNDDRRAPTVSLNSLKKTPLTGTRRRSALPREFREGSTDESTTEPPPPQTPATASSSTAAHSSSPAMTSTTLGRRSVLRTSRLSDDYRSSPSYSIRDLPRAHITPINTSTDPSTSTPSSSSATPATPASSTKSAHNPTDNSSTILSRSNTVGRHSAAQRERRQTLRAGSAESALGGPSGRSLVGEGLRAAGLSRRVGVVATLRERERDRATTERELDRMSLVSGSSGRSRRVDSTTQSPDVFKESPRVEWSPEATESLARHRRSVLDSASRTLPPRASTSMADYSYTSRSRHSRMSALQSDSEEDDDEGRGGRRESRAYKSTYGILTSREESLSRREQSLMERERELGRKERELERDRAGSVIARHHTGSTLATSAATPSPTPTPYSSSTVRERGERDNRYSSPFATTSRRTGSQSQHQSQNSLSHSEHAKLMVDSLGMFESQLHKLTPMLGSAGANHAEMLTRNAQILVVNAERLNSMLRSGNSRALDAQIEAEVECDYNTNNPGPQSSSLVDVWRRVGGEYREGLRASDDLVRAVTGLLLGVGRVMKEYVNLQYGGGSQYGSEAGSAFGGTPRSSPVVHGRSISLGEEDVRVRGGVSPDFTRESRRSWEPTPSGGGGGSSGASVSTGGGGGGGGGGSREEALRRLAGVRPDSPLARASPAFQAVRELDRLETASPGFSGGLGLPKVNIPPAVTRRLYAPSQQREMALVGDGGYDPSPTPASRTRVFDRGGELSVPTQQQMQRSPLQTAQEVTLERSRTVTLPPHQGGHNYDSPLRRNITISTPGGGGADGGEKSRHERRKISIASIATIRAVTSNANSTASSTTTSSSGPHSSGFMTAPSGATTAVTLDSGPMARTDSGNSGPGGGGNGGGNSSGSSLYSTSTKPTFSRPEGILSGLQQQLEGYRKRLESESAGVVAEGGDGSGGEVNKSGKRSGSMITPESERDTRRKTLGSRVGGARTSLDSTNGGGDIDGDGRGGGVVDLSVNVGDRSVVAAATVSGGGSGKKERRRAVTDIWTRG